MTRHLDKELSNNNPWDVMILHYGGLDHIGHLMGPFSSVVPKKLKEMDGVVRRIHEYLRANVRFLNYIINLSHHFFLNISQ